MHVIVARKSAESYHDIQSKSGMNFYTEAGFATVHSKCNATQQKLEEFHQLAKDTLVQGYNAQEVKLLVSKYVELIYSKLRQLNWLRLRIRLKLWLTRLLIKFFWSEFFVWFYIAAINWIKTCPVLIKAIKTGWKKSKLFLFIMNSVNH